MTVIEQLPQITDATLEFQIDSIQEDYIYKECPHCLKLIAVEAHDVEYCRYKHKEFVYVCAWCDQEFKDGD